MSNVTNFSGEDQRKIGMKLASEMNAQKTLALIREPNSSYEDILKSAASEVGVDKLASVILQNHPMWASYALRCLPNLGNNREALIKQASELVQTAPGAADNLAAAENKRIGGLELYLISGAAFEAHFTMFWLSAPNVNQPWAGNPDQGKWKWSDKLSIAINRSYSYKCSYFAIPNSPLHPGDTVWMEASIVCGNWYDTGFRFTYDPNAPTQRIDTWGASVNPQFGLYREGQEAKSA
jgi:hypothetical protein